MKIKLSKILSRKQSMLIEIIGRLAGDNSYEAYLVGGIVRDILMHKKNLDLDIAIEGDGLDFASKLAAKIKAQIISHLRFGTATLWLADNSRIDIATARKEIYEFPGALPKVTAGTIEDDLSRRDFSINAMAVSLNPARAGELVDYCRGLEDLKNKEIRVLHDLSFIDDPTRIIRAVRFKERFNFHLERQTARLLKQALRKKVFFSVKPQRLFAEVVKLLNEPDPKKNILVINRINGWDFISPKIKVSKKLLTKAEQQVKWFKSRFSEENLYSWLIYFIALLDKLTRKEKITLFAKFNLKTDERKRILDSSLKSGSLRILGASKVSPVQVYRVLNFLSCETVVFLMAKNSSGLIARRLREFLQRYRRIALSIDGADLKRLGFSEGRRIGKVLICALEAKIEGRLKTRSDELHFASHYLK